MATVPTRYGSREQLERCCAMMRANGIDVYVDLVDNHRDPDDRPAHFKYVDAYGNQTGGRFPKEPNDFHIYIGQDPDVPAGPGEIHFGRDFAPINGRVVNVDGKKVVWADYGLRQAGDWMTRALDLQGYRIDDVYGISWDWLTSFLDYGAMRGKFAVGEFNNGNADTVEGWVKEMHGRSTAFDFPLHDAYLLKMCNTPDDFDMSTLDGAGLVGIDPAHAVTFVENHDTDRSLPILRNKLLAYAFILTSQGYPCVYYRDWGMDLGCYGYGMRDDINRLIWIRENLASGDSVVRHKDKRTYVYERTGGKHLLVALNSDIATAHTVTCATGFGPNVPLHDYTGHAPDVATDASGNVTIAVPVDLEGRGYATYAPAGVAIIPHEAAANVTEQVYEGASDLDIKPADNTEFVRVCHVDVGAGKQIEGALTFDAHGWTKDTSIVLQLIGPSGTVQKTYTESTPQGAALSAKADVEGWYTFNIRSYHTPASNRLPAYSLKVRYTAPTTFAGITTSPEFHVERGGDGLVKSVTLTDGTPGARIYYTTDGSIPTLKSPRYKQSIMFNQTPQIVSAFAVAPSLLPSPIVANGYATSNVPVTFRLSHVPIQPGQKLYVVGNSHGLGMWNIGHAPELQRHGDGDTALWTVTVSLPIETSINYKYVLSNGKTEVWEQAQPTSSNNHEFTTPVYDPMIRDDGVFVAGGVSGAEAASCPVTFTVTCATSTAKSVVVAGSLPALGNWDPLQGLALTRQADGVTWQGTVKLPPGIPIEYKYVERDGGAPLWEADQRTPTKDREFTTPASGAVTRHDGSFGGAQGGICLCTFTIAKADPAPGQNVYVVGNVPTLGNWSTGQGFLLTKHGSGSSAVWSGSVNLPAGFIVQYKYLLFDGKTQVWEQDQPTSTGNREFKSPDNGPVTRDDGDFHG
jgi:alpha-amylase